MYWFFSFTMNEVKEGFDCNSPATDLELTFTTDFLPVEMFAMELEAEDMFVSDPEPVAISVSELEPAAMSSPEGALIQFDILKWTSYLCPHPRSSSFSSGPVRLSCLEFSSPSSLQAPSSPLVPSSLQAPASQPWRPYHVSLSWPWRSSKT